MLWLRDLSLTPTGTSWPKKTLKNNTTGSQFLHQVSGQSGHLTSATLPGNSQLAMTLQLHQRKGLQVHQGWSHWMSLGHSGQGAESNLIKNIQELSYLIS